MEYLMPFFIVVILVSCTILIWCLYKIYQNTTNKTKKIVQFCFWGIVITIMAVGAYFSPNSIFERAFHRGLAGGIAALILYFFYFLPHWIKKSKNHVTQKLQQKQKEARLTPFKIDIVNNEKYLGLTKSERIAFLRDLQKKTTVELEGQRKEIEKLKDIPDGVAKYIKVKDTSSLKKNITKLENKLTALDELIKAETATDLKVRNVL